MGAGSSGSMPGAIGGTVAGLSVLTAAVRGIGGGGSSFGLPSVGSVGASVGGVGPPGSYGTPADASKR